jgi:hypothetical protein
MIKFERNYQAWWYEFCRLADKTYPHPTEFAMKLTDKQCDDAIKRLWPYYEAQKKITYEREIYRAGFNAGLAAAKKKA